MKNNNKIIFIAEAGVNHNGSIDKACKLIDIAADAGADFIKFQHTNPSLISKKADLFYECYFLFYWLWEILSKRSLIRGCCFNKYSLTGLCFSSYFLLSDKF